MTSSWKSLFEKEDYNGILQSLSSDSLIAPQDLSILFVSFIKTDQFQRAIDFFQLHKSQASLCQDSLFCYCYALYRLQRFSEALDHLLDVDDDDDSKNGSNLLRFNLLKAQILYRMERYQESFEIFSACKSQNSSLFAQDAEILTNIIAAYALGNSTCEKTKDSLMQVKEAESCNSFEALCNAGFLEAHSGNFSRAESLLLKAIRLCEGSKDAFDEEEIKSELNFIRLHLSYVYCMTEDQEKALKLLKEIPEPLEAGNALIWKNNLKLASGSFLAFADEKDLGKLNSLQREQILRNICYARRTRFFLLKYISLYPDSSHSSIFKDILNAKEVSNCPLTGEFSVSSSQIQALLLEGKLQEAISIAKSQEENSSLDLSIWIPFLKHSDAKQYLKSALERVSFSEAFNLLDKLMKSQQFALALELIPYNRSDLHNVRAFCQLQIPSIDASSVSIPSDAFALEDEALKRILSAVPSSKKILRKSHSRNPKPKVLKLRIDPERWIAKRNRSKKGNNRK